MIENYVEVGADGGPVHDYEKPGFVPYNRRFTLRTVIERVPMGHRIYRAGDPTVRFDPNDGVFTRLDITRDDWTWEDAPMWEAG